MQFLIIIRDTPEALWRHTGCITLVMGKVKALRKSTQSDINKRDFPSDN
jgi:hypothetical protein